MQLSGLTWANQSSHSSTLHCSLTASVHRNLRAIHYRITSLQYCITVHWLQCVLPCMVLQYSRCVLRLDITMLTDTSLELYWSIKSNNRYLQYSTYSYSDFGKTSSGLFGKLRSLKVHSYLNTIFHTSQTSALASPPDKISFDFSLLPPVSISIATNIGPPLPAPRIHPLQQAYQLSPLSWLRVFHIHKPRSQFRPCSISINHIHNSYPLNYPNQR